MPISLDGSGTISGISTFSFSEEIIHTGDTNTAIKFPSNDTISFDTSGSERLRITNDGNIGIGTISSNVSGFNADAKVVTLSGPKRGILELRGHIAAADTIGSIRFLSTNDTEAEIKSVTDSNGDNGDLRFETNGGERLRIDSNGQLLVGTTSSGANVRAVFQGYNGGGENFQARVQFQTNQATNLSTGHHIANLLFTNASNSVGAQIDVKADADWGTNDYPGRIEFKTTADGANSPTERLRITSSGIVNIGTNNQASGHASSKLRVGTASGSDAGVVVFGNGDTTTPALIITNWDGAQTQNKSIIHFDNSGWGSFQIGSTAGVDAFGIFDDSVERFRIHANGAVTMPHHPAFQATRNGMSAIQIASSANQDVVFSSVDFDQGSDYNNSNGRFTAPVAGKYFFGIQLYTGFNVTSVRVVHAYFTINGGISKYADLFGGIGNFGNSSMNHYHPTVFASCMLNLAVNDYVTFNLGSSSFIGSGNTYVYGTSGSRFFGYLVA